MSIKLLQVSMGEASKVDREEYSLCFTLCLLQETNYAVFVKASLLLPHCGPKTSLLADGGAP